MKFFTVITLIFLTGGLIAQTRNNHLIGLNAEVSTMPKIVGKRLGVNLTYLYSYKKFCAKVDLGILPNTNFGTVAKGSACIGLTSDVNVAISGHALVGVILLEGNKGYTNDKGYNYFMSISNYCSNLGVLVRPTKNERLSLGLDMIISFYYIEPQGLDEYHLHEGNAYRGLIPFFNLSVNYKLNKPRTASTGKKSVFEP